MSEPLSKEQLEAIERRLRAATPGPWAYDREGAHGDGAVVSQSMDFGGYPLSICRRLLARNAEFIAGAPTDIAALLTEVARLTLELRRGSAPLPVIRHVLDAGPIQAGYGAWAPCRHAMTYSNGRCVACDEQVTT